MKIIYTGLREDTLNTIIENLALQEALFLPVPEAELSSSRDGISNGDIVLIGENAENPIQLTQKVYGYDKNLSILIINDATNYNKIKQSLLFTPFIGSTVHPVSNAAGKGLAAVVKDHIQRTQQRRSYKKFQSSTFSNPVQSAEKSERVKAEYLSRAFEEAPVGLVLINKSGFILSFNRFASSLFNKTEREVLGTPLPDLFPEKEQAGFLLFLKEAQENKIKKVIEYPSEAHPRFFETVISRVDKDDPSYKIVLINEITEKVLAQKAIEENAQKVKMIVGSMPEMAWTALPSGEIDFLNNRWYEYTGQNPSDPSSTGWVKAIHPEDFKKAESLWKKALQKGTLYQLECRYLKASDKKYQWHLTRALPVRSPEGTILHWVGTCTEIQSLKNTEEELQKTAEELAASNEELTAANEEINASLEELNETNERLIKVNADLDNFIYTASHDLKAPILNIEGLVHILGRKLKENYCKDEKIKDIINMIITSIQRFRGTIGDLTEISKLQRLSELESVETDIPEIIEEVKLDLQQQILEADAELKILVEGCHKVVFSRKNLKSIIYNLLSNAIKYRSHDHKLKVEILVYDEEDYVVLSIKDNGLGMNLKDKNKVFGMFQRMHSHVEGTGVGLYIVKKIIETAGGSITVESQVGQGSVFRVFFPKMQ